MKYINKISFLTILFCTFSVCKTYSLSASRYYHKESETSSGYSEVTDSVIFNQLLNLSSLKVKFTQNDTQYIFDVSANASVDVSSYLRDCPLVNVRTGSIGPLLYKVENFGSGLEVYESGIMPFADFTRGNVYTTEYVKRGSTYIYGFDDRYRQVSSDKITNQSRTYENNGGNFYIYTGIRNAASGRTFNYMGARNYPAYFSPSGVSVLSNGSYLNVDSSYTTVYYTFKSKIAITKSRIDELRYLCFGQAYIVANDSIMRDLEQCAEGVSVCTNTIDLKEYVDCNHDWEMSIKDKNSHIVCCKNCEWEKEESHNLIYEYDGIKNNICTCSYIDKVKYYYEINDDFTKEAVEICDVDSDYVKHKFQSKTGYKFNWYDKYEKQLIDSDSLSTKSNAMRTVFIATSSDFDEVASNKSTIYKSNVTPIKYKIKYSNDNDKNISIDGSIEDQEIDYDEEVKLNDNIYCKGYLFSGWTLDKNKRESNFDANQKIKNLTTEDNKEFTLYPLYDELEFNVKYNSGVEVFADGSKEKTIHYNYFDDKDLERPVIRNPESHFMYYVDDSGNKFSSISDIKNFVEQNGKANVNLNLRAVIGTDQYGKPERPNPGGITPTTPSINIEETIGNEIVESETETTVNTNYYFKKKKDKLKKQKGDEKIFAMTKTDGMARRATISYIGLSGPPKAVKTFGYRLMMLKYLISKYKIAFICGSLMVLALITIYELFIIRHFMSLNRQK